METKERIVNFRPLLIIALMLCLSVVFMVELYSNLLFLIPAILIFLIVLLFCVLKKKFVFMAIVLFIYLLGFGVTALTIETFSNKYEKVDCVVYGRVRDISFSGYEGRYYLQLSNVELDFDGSKEKLEGKTNVTIYGVTENTIAIGDFISGQTKLSNIEILEDEEINNDYYSDNIRYSCSLSYDKTMLIRNGPNLIEKLKINSKNNLANYMGEDIGGISYAVLFGDKSLIEYQTKLSFRESGVAHILAVSGLHIGFLFALLYFFLNKLPLNRWVKFLILAVALFMYCFICQFSPSVVRASIMCLCLLFTKLLGKQYDSLSSLSLAFVIIILFRPLYVFDVGFQMSFGAVLGAILVLKVIDRFNFKNKFIKGIVSTISVSVATQLGIIPIIAKSFGYLATYSIFANILTIPVFAIFYPLLCVFNLFVLISNIFSFLLVVPFALMKTIVSITDFVSGLPFSYIGIFGMGTVGTLLYYLGMFVLGGFVNIKDIFKILSVTLLFSMAIMFVAINNIPYKFTTNNFCLNNGNYYASINTEDNVFCLIDIDTTKSGIAKIKRNLQKRKISKINVLLFANNTEFVSADIATFAKEYNATIYLPQNHGSVANLLLENCDIVEYDDSKMFYTEFGSMQTFTYSNGKLIELNINDKNILYVCGEFCDKDILDIKQQIRYPFYVICYDEKHTTMQIEEVFYSNYYLYYGEEYDIVI